MKFIKKFLFVLIVIVAFGLIMAFFIDSEFMVSRSQKINRSQEDVMAYVHYLDNLEEYNAMLSSGSTEFNYNDVDDGEVGSILKWKSSNASTGSGEIEVIGRSENQIDLEIRVQSPVKQKLQGIIYTTSIAQETTEVTWELKGEVNYPYNITLLFKDMDALFGPDLEKGLVNLKDILEEQ
jgi:hypothetical protein